MRQTLGSDFLPLARCSACLVFLVAGCSQGGPSVEKDQFDVWDGLEEAKASDATGAIEQVSQDSHSEAVDGQLDFLDALDYDGFSGDADASLDIPDATDLRDAEDSADVCLPDCDGQECGDDGCGGSCSTCAEGDECVEGTCVCQPICPACNMHDGCGGFCLCQEGYGCVLGKCKDCYDGPLEFPDPALAERVAEWYGTEVGETTMADVAGEDYLPVIDRGVLLLDGLECLQELTTLYVDENDFGDLAPIAGLSLGAISFLNTPVSNLEPLRHMDPLQQIWASGTSVETLAPLSALDLLTLILQDAELKDLGGLETQGSIVKLSLRVNQISDISGLKGCTSLLKLDLLENQITDISPLADLVSLKDLNLHKNQITDISSLAGLVNLELLSLGANQISDFSPLAGLEKIERLALSGNFNPEVGVVSYLVSLRGLSMGGNLLKTIPDLTALESLEHLGITNNEVEDLSPVTPVESLEELWADSNLITDLTPLVDNPGISEGDYVNVLWNPIDCTEQAANIAELKARGVELDIQCPCEVCL